jgi:MerR HTH family regulatory protein/Histidine kinase-like ATPase domain
MTVHGVAGREPYFEIGAVARELGVAPSTLRTWERRYRLIVPRRSASGQRLYDADEVRRLRLIQTQIRRGTRAGAAHSAASQAAPVRSEHVELAPTPDAPRRARRAVDAVAGPAEDGRFAFFLRLVASELVNNAVMHGVPREPISLDVDMFDRWAEVRVRNAGGRFSLKSLRRRRANAGRGLEIVDALAEAWTIDSGPFGTTVTVRLPLEPAAATCFRPAGFNGPEVGNSVP